MMKFRISNCSNCGKLMLLTGLLVSIPLIVIPFYPEDTKYFFAFILPALGSMGLGILVCLLGNNDNDNGLIRQSSMKQGSLIVLFAWIWGIVVGSLPFVLGHQLTIIQAIFESVSGWTTTGLSTMDVSITPNIYLFHRSFMQFCGGLGFVLMMVMIISGKQSMSLFNAEGHPDKLMPNLKKTAQTIFIIYSAFLVIGTIAYWLAGMNFFESICHAMCSLSTGGFSTKLGSIGDYDSILIEIITIILMLIGTTNFAVLLLVAKGRWHQVIRVSEVRFMVGLLLIFIPIIAISLMNGLHMGLIESFRRAAFDTVSALSTSGYSSMSYVTWPPITIGILILLMLIGGGIGSTAGGLKMTRVYLMLRLAIKNIRQRLSPTAQVEVSYYMKAQGKTLIDSALAMDTIGFISCYFVIFIVGSLLITLSADCGLIEAMFEFASALGTVGLSIGITSPTTQAGTLIIEIIGMLLGRLEIFIVLIGLHCGFDVIRKFILKKAFNMLRGFCYIA